METQVSGWAMLTDQEMEQASAALKTFRTRERAEELVCLPPLGSAVPAEVSWEQEASRRNQ